MDKDGTTVGTQRRIGCPSGLGIYPNDVTSFLTHPHDEWVAGISNHCRSVFGCFLEGRPPIATQESQLVIAVKLVAAEAEQHQHLRGAHCYDISDDSFVGLQHRDSGVRSLSQS